MNELDKLSLENDKKLFSSNQFEKIEVGIVKGLQQIYKYCLMDYMILLV